MFLALIAVISQTAFDGGTANDFVRSVAKATDQNVVFAQSEVSAIKPFSYNPANLSEMSRAFRAKLGIQIVPGTSLILHNGLVPKARIASFGLPKELPKWRSLEEGEVKNGKVTCVTQEKERLDPQLLQNAPFGKPLKVHWFFAQTPVSAHVSGMPEVLFLTYVAKAVGGRFIETPKEYKIDFDADEIKARTIQTLSTWPKEQLPNIEDRPLKTEQHVEMLRAMVEEMPIGSFASAFPTQTSKGTFDLRAKSRLAKLIQDIFVRNVSTTDDAGAPAIRTPIGPIPIAKLLDGSYRFEGSLSATFEMRIAMYNRQNPRQAFFSWEYQRLGQ